MKASILVLMSFMAIFALSARDNGKTSRYEGLGNDAVLASVNGCELTKGLFEGLVKVKMGAASGKRRMNDRQRESFERKIRALEYQNFFPVALFATEATRLGLKPSAEHRQELMANYAKSYGRPKETFESFCARLPELERNSITNLFERDLLNQVYIRHELGSKLVVSTEEVSNQVAVTVAYNKRMSLTNELVYAQASNILARARAGADFSELADEYSEDEEKNPGGDMGFCTVEDFREFEAPSYWENIVCLKPGEITDVMTTESGVEIVKFLGEKEDVYEDGSLIARHLARILWRRAIIFDASYDFILRLKTRELRSEVVGKAARELRAKAVVTYPNGEDILYPPRKKKLK